MSQHDATAAFFATQAGEVDAERRAGSPGIPGASRHALDGDWAWEDAPAGYLLLDSLAQRGGP